MTTTTLIEQGSDLGAYDMRRDYAVIEHPKHGRLLICEGFGGMDKPIGGKYRWIHGRACKLDADETIAGLKSKYPSPRIGGDIDIDAAMYGRELYWRGVVIDGIARSVCL